MIQRLTRRIGRSLFLFLSLFSLVVSVLVFWIVANYNLRNYTGLAAAHMEQQYQNVAKQIAVVQESTRLLSGGDAFQALLRQQEWATAKERILEFTVSQPRVESVNLYTLQDGTASRVAGYRTYDGTYMAPAELGERLAAQESAAYTAEWLLRQPPSGRSSVFSLIYPVYTGEDLLAVLVVDINLAQLLGRAPGDTMFADGEMRILGADGLWDATGGPVDIPTGPNIAEGALVRTKGGLVVGYTLPASKDILVQRIPMDVAGILLPVGLTLLAVYLCSLALFYPACRLVTRSVTQPLQSLHGKIQATLQQDAN